MEIYTRCYFCHTDLTTCNNSSSNSNVQHTPGNSSSSLQRGYQIKLAEYSHSQLQIDGQPTGQRHQATYLQLSFSPCPLSLRLCRHIVWRCIYL